MNAPFLGSEHIQVTPLTPPPPPRSLLEDSLDVPKGPNKVLRHQQISHLLGVEANVRGQMQQLSKLKALLQLRDDVIAQGNLLMVLYRESHTLEIEPPLLQCILPPLPWC